MVNEYKAEVLTIATTGYLQQKVTLPITYEGTHAESEVGTKCLKGTGTWSCSMEMYSPKGLSGECWSYDERGTREGTEKEQKGKKGRKKRKKEKGSSPTAQS